VSSTKYHRGHMRHADRVFETPARNTV